MIDPGRTLWSDGTDPPTPEEQLDSLVAIIDALVAGGSLKTGQATGLTRPLRNARRSLAGGHIASACSQLSSFGAEVRRKVADGALTAGEGTALIQRRGGNSKGSRLLTT